MAEATTNQEQSLIKPEVFDDENTATNGYMNEFKGQAQEYGQKFQEAAVKAKDYASEKFKELQGKDPQELVENAKEYARQKPGQALLISAAAGLVIGLLLKGGRR